MRTQRWARSPTLIILNIRSPKRGDLQDEDQINKRNDLQEQIVILKTVLLYITCDDIKQLLCFISSHG